MCFKPSHLTLFNLLPMNSSIAQVSELSPTALSQLEDCSEESIYSPGYIQPHGILIRLEETQLTILQMSENVGQIWGITALALVGQSLQRLFSRPQVRRVAELLQQDNLELNNPFELKARGHTFRSTLYRTKSDLILELEPQLATDKTPSMQFCHRLQMSVLSLRSTTSIQDLVQTLAKQVRVLTGFDRVMIYRFEADDHGVVVAEEKEAHLESYLGLHFPATDIPVLARQLFLRNWVRAIPDIHYIPARLIPTDAVLPPLDMSSCILRGVSPCHIEYLENMGVAATLTISLIDDQHLWGLIACHHYSPKLVDYQTRKTCEFLGQFASVELVHQQGRELNYYRTQVQSIQTRLQQAFYQSPNFIQQILTRHATELLSLVNAEGVAIVLEQQISLLGQTPPLPEVQELLVWLSENNQAEVFSTHCLAHGYAPAAAFTQTASGLLAISIVLHQQAYHLLWFRPEQVQTVNWAGNPKDAVVTDELGNLNLCPRKSFELWKETTRQMSQPWQIVEVEAARMMRNTLLLAVLEFSLAALEQSAERAAIANRAKSQFLAKMSHELRTPLNAILGFSQVMHHSPDTPAEFQEHLGIINRSGKHLLALINDVLEMSRIEAGQLVLTERPFNLHYLLQSVQEMFALKAAQKGLFLSFEEDPKLPRYICSDEAKLRQILINLISNAIKFTTEGGVTVRVSATRISSTKDVCTCDLTTQPMCQQIFQLSLVVSDTGCGIDQNDWESIFDAFMQTEQGRFAQGTGLGLSISRQFARLMEGDISVHSVVNQGATFTCQVLIRQPHATQLLEPKATTSVVGLEPGQPTYRILIAEDVSENRQLLVTLLEPVGFEVCAVTDGIDAIAHWQTWQPHLILMDIQMPGVDGYEATRQIRAQEAASRPQTKADVPIQPTKIIALTAYAFEDDRISSLEAGCDDHITKPFTETALFDAIARHLGVHYLYRENAVPESSYVARKALTPHDLKVMSAEWIAQIHEAALDLRDEKIRELIAQIPPSEQELIQAMTSLVNDFQMEAIATLTLV